MADEGMIEVQVTMRYPAKPGVGGYKTCTTLQECADLDRCAYDDEVLELAMLLDGDVTVDAWVAAADPGVSR